MPDLRKLNEAAAPGKAQVGVMGFDYSHVVDFGVPPASPFMRFMPGSVSHSDDDTSEANAALVAALWNAYRATDDATRNALQTALDKT